MLNMNRRHFVASSGVVALAGMAQARRYHLEVDGLLDTHFPAQGLLLSLVDNDVTERSRAFVVDDMAEPVAGFAPRRAPAVLEILLDASKNIPKLGRCRGESAEPRSTRTASR